MQHSEEIESTLPLLSEKTGYYSTREMQKFSAKEADLLKETGPKIVLVHGKKTAVLVDFDQYVLLQDRFKELLGIASATHSFFSDAPVNLQKSGWQVDSFKIQIKATLSKIVTETPSNSPLQLYFNQLWDFAQDTYKEGDSSPMYVQENAKALSRAGSKRIKRS